MIILINKDYLFFKEDSVTGKKKLRPASEWVGWLIAIIVIVIGASVLTFMIVVKEDVVLTCPPDLCLPEDVINQVKTKGPDNQACSDYYIESVGKVRSHIDDFSSQCERFRRSEMEKAGELAAGARERRRRVEGGAAPPQIPRRGDVLFPPRREGALPQYS